MNTLCTRDLPHSIRVAFASNEGEQLDGHFGSCRRFLIYQVASEEVRLIAVRDAQNLNSPSREQQNNYRAELVSDCHILYVLSIGGPPAARVVNRGVHPVKHPHSARISELLPPLQQVLGDKPPPWLAKILRHSGEQVITNSLVNPSFSQT